MMLLFSREDISSSLGIDVTEVDEYIKLRLVMGRLPLKTTTFSVATVVTILEDQVYGRAAKSIDQMDTIEKFLDKWNTNILHSGKSVSVYPYNADTIIVEIN